METNLLDRMLNTYLTEHTTVTVTLQTRGRVTGRIKAFDSYVVVLDGQRSEILYRHAISSVSPFLQEKQKPVRETQKRLLVPAARPQQKPALKPENRKPKTAQTQPVHSASLGEQSINSSMKDGLIKWMQEQKAAK